MAKKKQETEDAPRIEYVALEEIARWPRNPRHHDDTAIEKSMRRFGFINPIVLDERSGKIVAGHGRLTALESIRDAGEAPPARVQIGAGGRWFAPVLRGVSFSNAAEAEAFLVADNRIAEVGGWDTEGLKELLRDLDNDGVDLDGLGWSTAAIDKLLEENAASAKRAPSTEGRSSDDLSSVNVNARLVPIYLSAEEYQRTIDRMQAVMTDVRLPDYTALLFFLLDHYDASRPGKPAASDPFEVP